MKQEGVKLNLTHSMSYNGLLCKYSQNSQECQMNDYYYYLSCLAMQWIIRIYST